MCHSYDDVIENIKKIIDDKGMKQSVVAERAGFTASQFNDIINTRRKRLRTERLWPIAMALGVDMNAIFGMDKMTVGSEDI